MKPFFKNWKTTIAGVLAIVLIMLSNTGIITPSEQTELNTVGNELVNHIDGIIAGITAIALIFSQDAKE